MICPSCGHDNIPGEDVCVECRSSLAGTEAPSDGLRGHLHVRRAGELPIVDTRPLRSTDTVAAALRAMRDDRQGCVLVVDDGGRLAGIFTERDVLLRVADEGRDPERTPLDEVMTRDPVTLDARDPLAFALHRMAVGGFRHLPVLEGDAPRGFISVRTLLRNVRDEVL